MSEVLIWHDEVHRRLESSLLYFWRLSFGHKYDRIEVLARLRSLYRDAGIYAHIAYEALGDFDLLLRLWIPRTLTADEFDNMLNDALASYSIEHVAYVQCRTILHWRQNVDLELDDNSLTISDDAIADINAYNDAQWGDFLSESDSTSVEPEDVADLVNLGVVSRLPLTRRGIRFYILFDHPRKPLTPAQRGEVVNSIKAKCFEIDSHWQEGEHPSQISLYAGAGTMTDFLVVGRTPYGKFHAYINELVDGLRSLHLSGLFGVRTTTHVIATEMFSDFAEQRPAVRSGAFDPADVLGDEDERLEFKATFAVNLARLRAQGERVNNDRRRKRTRTWFGARARGTCYGPPEHARRSRS